MEKEWLRKLFEKKEAKENQETRSGEEGTV
jgi:hypothetical protein